MARYSFNVTHRGLNNLTCAVLINLIGILLLTPPHAWAGGPGPANHIRVIIRTLTVNEVASLCSRHPRSQYRANIRSYFVLRVLQFGAGHSGGVGGLYQTKHRLGSLNEGDSTPFVNVGWVGHGASWILVHRVVLEGTLDCRGTVVLPGEASPTVVGQFSVKWWTKSSPPSA